MKRLKISYLKYIIECIILGIVLLQVKSSSYKMNTLSSNENVNKNVNLSTMAIFINKEEDEKAQKEAEEAALQTYMWGILDSYTGDLTGYEAYCPLCSGRLACKSDLDLSNGHNTYEDITYGKINIVAASTNLPCGTIIKFNNNKISEEPIVAIVLDRGVSGNDIDFLSPNKEFATKYIGRTSITYDVLRFGWEK